MAKKVGRRSRSTSVKCTKTEFGLYALGVRSTQAKKLLSVRESPNSIHEGLARLESAIGRAELPANLCADLSPHSPDEFSIFGM